MDVFPRAALIPHLEQCLILFRCRRSDEHRPICTSLDCRVADLDRPFTPVGEGSNYLFPQAAILLHLVQLFILLWHPCHGECVTRGCDAIALILEYEVTFRSITVFAGASSLEPVVTNVSTKIGRLKRSETQDNLNWDLHYPIPDPRTFREAFEGPLLVLCNWYSLLCSGGTSRRS